jgi:glycosyltransferase involved in cell wall biosynthesis
MNQIAPISRPLAFKLLIPCYNNREGLIRSLESVSFPPNESGEYGILIVDDGSTEPVSLSWFKNIIDSSVPLEILRLPVNSGITVALNAGLERIARDGNVRYIARLDCGDVCVPERFTEQVAFLEAHPEIDLVGSWCVFEAPGGLSYLYKTPTEHAGIRKGMYFRNIFIHPTVMWRTSAMAKVGVYPNTFPHAEDYGFFQMLLQKGRGAVIPRPLVTCELNPAGISRQFRQAQLRSRMKVVLAFGENKWLKTIGVVKLLLLQLVPYSLLLTAKKVWSPG